MGMSSDTLLEAGNVGGELGLEKKRTYCIRLV